MMALRAAPAALWGRGPGGLRVLQRVGRAGVPRNPAMNRRQKGGVLQ